VESFIEVIYTFTAVQNSQKRQKTGGFAYVLAYKSLKTQFFALKYLTRYTHETFFEEYIDIKIFRSLSRCGVIPVRSFESHIRPQPHRLGLTLQSPGKVFQNLGIYFIKSGCSVVEYLTIFSLCDVILLLNPAAHWSETKSGVNITTGFQILVRYVAVCSIYCQLGYYIYLFMYLYK
jgi:hypothetical protein